MSGVALHGGGAAKVSGDFEEDWTLLTMLDMLSGHADRIRLEIPGQAGWGFEFWIGRESVREWHQVKFQNGNIAKWTIRELARAEILENFRSKLVAETDATCCFVSADGIAPLDRLCDRAILSRNFHGFSQELLSAKELEEAFTALGKDHWDLSEEETWRWLKDRVAVEHVTHRFLSRSLSERVRTRIEGEPLRAIQALREIKQEGLYFEMSAEQFEERLRGKGFPPRIWSDQQSSPADAVTDASQRFRTTMDSRQINGMFLPRQQVTEIRALLESHRPPQTILVVGGKGHGKSAVVSEVVSWALGSPWKVLAVDTGSLNFEQDTAAVGDHLSLPDTPGVTLAAAAAGGRGLLIIDALDSVGLNRDKPPQLFRVVGEVIEEARRHQNITLLISCRSEDLASDDRLRILAEGPHAAAQIDVPALSADEVGGALAQAGVDPGELSGAQLELLRIPTCLKYLSESKDAGPYNFETEADLVERFLDLPPAGGAQ